MKKIHPRWHRLHLHGVYLPGVVWLWMDLLPGTESCGTEAMSPAGRELNSSWSRTSDPVTLLKPTSSVLTSIMSITITQIKEKSVDTYTYHDSLWQRHLVTALVSASSAQKFNVLLGEHLCSQFTLTRTCLRFWKNPVVFSRTFSLSFHSTVSN